MRYSIGLVLAVALVASPLTVRAQSDDEASSGDSVRLDVQGITDGRWVHEPPLWLRLELDTAGLRLTSSELQRLALIPQHLQERVPGHRKKPSDDDAGKSDFEIDYVAAEQEAVKKRRGLAIALGITIPLVVAGIGVGIAVAVFASNFEL